MTRSKIHRTAIAASLLTLASSGAVLGVACSSSSTTPGGNGTPDSGNQGTSDGGLDATIADAGIDTGVPFDANSISFSMDSGITPVDASIPLPANFVMTEHGGYALGPAIQGDGLDAGNTANNNDGGTNCGGLFVGVVRDFRTSGVMTPGHPDFETFLDQSGGRDGGATAPNLVTMTLGTDQKPVYAGHCDDAWRAAHDSSAPTSDCPAGQMMTTEANFNQWYHYTSGTNLPFLLYVQFAPNDGGTSTFESANYFPLDDAGYGNSQLGGTNHNYSFTTELHLSFKYNGGETFTFAGDDDLWVFINGKLAMDLGGVHTTETASLHLDSLGLTQGNVYPIDIFNAERHSIGSDVRIDTNLAFTNCGVVPPDVPR